MCSRVSAELPYFFSFNEYEYLDQCRILWSTLFSRMLGYLSHLMNNDASQVRTALLHMQLSYDLSGAARY